MSAADSLHRPGTSDDTERTSHLFDLVAAAECGFNTVTTELCNWCLFTENPKCLVL